MIIKKWNTSTTAWEEQYPKTTIDKIYQSNGTDTFLSSGKLRVSYLPDLIFGGLNFEGALTSTNADTDVEMAGLLDAVYQARGSVNLEGMVGSYWVANSSFDQNISMQATEAGTTNRYYATTSNQYIEEGQADGDDEITLESGDWLVIQGVSGSGTYADPFEVDFSVVNNTYKIADASRAGIIKVGYTSDNSAREYGVSLDGNNKAYVSVPWTDNTFRTVTAGGNTLEQNETLAFTAGTNVSISENAGAVTIASTDTRRTIQLSGVEKLSNSSTTALNFAVGNNMSITENNGAFTFNSSHPSISAASDLTASSRTYVTSLDLDSNGHILSIGTGTETVTDTTYTAGNGIALSGSNQFSVANGQGLTQEASGLAMTYPVYHGDTLPTLTSSSIYSNVIGFEW